MIALIQRVTQASVSVENEVVGQIAGGVLLFLGVQKGDKEEQANNLLKKVLNYRIFPDDEGRMNQSLLATKGELLVVSQFTLAADTGNGTRPGFSRAAAPQDAQALYELFCQQAAKELTIQTGVFGANMQVSLVNDGPVTFWLEV